MYRIVPTLKFGDVGPDVVNLQQGLRFLIDQGCISTYQPPESPTADDLSALSKQLIIEYTNSHFGDATQNLLFFIQLQNGIGDNLKGMVVENTTAAKLNLLLETNNIVWNSLSRWSIVASLEYSYQSKQDMFQVHFRLQGDPLHRILTLKPASFSVLLQMLENRSVIAYDIKEQVFSTSTDI